MKLIIHVAILIAVVFIAYGNTLDMYFWHDDYTGIYYSQQHDLNRFNMKLGTLLARSAANLFGLQPIMYLSVGILLYVIATIQVYFLLYLFTRKSTLSLLSSLTFAVGYIGQRDMFYSFDLVTPLGLNIFLLTLLSFIKYAKSKAFYLLAISFTCFFLTLELIPQRAAGLIPIMMISTYLFLPKDRRNLLVLLSINFVFIIIALLQYLVRPSVFLLRLLVDNVQGKTGLEEPARYLTVLKDFNIIYIFKFLGTIGNLVYPSIYQQKLLEYLNHLPLVIPNQAFWFSTLPLLIFILVSFILIILLKPKSRKEIGIYLLSTMGAFYLIDKLIVWLIKDGLEQVYISNGVLVTLYLLFLFFINLPKSRSIMFFSFLLTVFIIIPTYIVMPSIIITSSHRYLFLSSISVPLITTFFMAKELHLAKVKAYQRKIAWLIFLFPTVMIAIVHLSAGILTQREFVERVSKPTREFYSQLKRIIPQANRKTIIYVEAATASTLYSLGEATRVGDLPSEAAYAVNLKSKMENILLPEKIEDIPSILDKNPDINISDVYTFMWDEKNLQDTSQMTRQFLLGNKLNPLSLSLSTWEVIPKETLANNSSTEILHIQTFFLTDEEKNTLGITPSLVFKPKVVISTQFPLKMELYIKVVAHHTIPIPYYHLFHWPGTIDRQSWENTLDYEITQCREGIPEGFLDCLENTSQLDQQFWEKIPYQLDVTWNYNTIAPSFVDKKSILGLKPDGLWHKYKILIPAGGEYLKEINLSHLSFPGDLYVKDITVQNYYPGKSY